MPSAWNTRFAQLVAKVLALRESTTLEPLPDLMPTLPVLDPSAVELLQARGEQPCMGFASQAAVAGVRAVVQVVNPANSGQLLAIDRIWPRIATGNWVYARLTSVANVVGAQNVTGVMQRDFRRAGAMVGQVWLGTDAMAISPPWGVVLASGPSLELALQTVLRPGDILQVWAGPVNVEFGCSFSWRERPVGADEL